MTLQEKSLFLSNMGVTVYHLWDWMDSYGLPDMNTAVEHYYDAHYGTPDQKFYILSKGE